MRRIRLPQWANLIILLILITALWDIGVRIFDVSPAILPSPKDVGGALTELLGTSLLWRHFGVTVYEILVGFGVAAFAGVLTGAILAKLPSLERFLNPLIVAIQVTPKTPLIPILIVWFGFGVSSKVIVAAIFAYFPVFRNTVLGVKNVDSGHADLMTIVGARPRQRFFKVELPSALPLIFAGMEVGMVLAVIGATVGEFLSGNKGLGYLAIEYLNTYQIPKLFAAMILLTLMGYAFHILIGVATRYAIPWHQSVRGGN